MFISKIRYLVQCTTHRHRFFYIVYKLRNMLIIVEFNISSLKMKLFTMIYIFQFIIKIKIMISKSMFIQYSFVWIYTREIYL